MTMWQPIKTAPRAGVIIYCQRRDDGKFGVGLAYRAVDGQWHDSEAGWRLLHPTHWMALPKPPTDDAFGEQAPSEKA